MEVNGLLHALAILFPGKELSISTRYEVGSAPWSFLIS